ncbi:Transcriptional regulator OS=Lysinibacillus sphaericus OX=1421 GN=LS41612_21315 PE=4 SV=1 [Lysinibacillus sphaericus]
MWRTNQSKTLLMNTVASQITLFTDFSVECEGPSLCKVHCLYEWAKSLTKIANANLEYSELVMREAEELKPDSYPTRAFYGHYLEWVFKEVVLTMPSNVMVYTHQTRAIAIDDAYDGSQIVQLEKDNVHLRVDAVVLAQGHTPVSLSPEEEKLRKIAAEKGMVSYYPE